MTKIMGATKPPMYTVVKDIDLTYFISKVNHYLSQGWELVGGVTYHPTKGYLQALVIYS